MPPQAAAAVSSWHAVPSVKGGRLTVAFEDALCPNCGADSAAQPWSRRIVAAGAFGLSRPAVERASERHPVACACAEERSLSLYLDRGIYVTLSASPPHSRKR